MASRQKYTCTKCGQAKFKKDFGPRIENKNGLDSWCKECKRAIQREYVAARRKDPLWKERHNAQARKSNIGKYGISEFEYEKIAEVQGGVCAGCGRPPPPGRRLDLDHEHLPGEKHREPWERAAGVRGLLCYRCNRALGLLRDDPNTFRNLANYLENPPARPIVKEMLLKLLAYFKDPPFQRFLRKQKNEKSEEPSEETSCQK